MLKYLGPVGKQLSGDLGRSRTLLGPARVLVERALERLRVKGNQGQEFMQQHLADGSVLKALVIAGVGVPIAKVWIETAGVRQKPVLMEGDFPLLLVVGWEEYTSGEAIGYRTIPGSRPPYLKIKSLDFSELTTAGEALVGGQVSPWRGCSESVFTYPGRQALATHQGTIWWRTSTWKTLAEMGPIDLGDTDLSTLPEPTCGVEVMLNQFRFPVWYYPLSASGYPVSVGFSSNGIPESMAANDSMLFLARARNPSERTWTGQALVPRSIGVFSFGLHHRYDVWLPHWETSSIELASSWGNQPIRACANGFCGVIWQMGEIPEKPEVSASYYRVFSARTPADPVKEAPSIRWSVASGYLLPYLGIAVTNIGTGTQFDANLRFYAVLVASAGVFTGVSEALYGVIVGDIETGQQLQWVVLSAGNGTAARVPYAVMFYGDYLCVAMQPERPDRQQPLDFSNAVILVYSTEGLLNGGAVSLVLQVSVAEIAARVGVALPVSVDFVPSYSFNVGWSAPA